MLENDFNVRSTKDLLLIKKNNNEYFVLMTIFANGQAELNNGDDSFEWFV